MFTDLDGTLLDNHHELSFINRQTLRRLGNNGVFRVVITGRSLASATGVLDSDFPIDILVTSSGAGIYSFPEKILLRSSVIDRNHVRKYIELLKTMDLDFMVHFPVPDNHLFSWHRSLKKNGDFDRRLNAYRGQHSPLRIDANHIGEAAQLLVICPQDKNSEIHISLQKNLSNSTIIRTTSPLDQKSIWYEIFPYGISKSSSAAWLCKQYDLDSKNALAIGNDYNDKDLLHWCRFSRIVENAPASLKKHFTVVQDNNNNGFSQAVDEWLAHLKKDEITITNYL